MERQSTFTDLEYASRRKKTKRDMFLEKMEALVPWNRWIKLIEPYYYKNERGRRPRGIEIMLRMYLLQVWFSLSDEAVEDAIFDSYAMRSFAGINFDDEQAPDATTLLRFRHLLEENGLQKKLFEDLNEHLKSEGLTMGKGTIVDATIISAPSSTKNKSGERDPEMHSTKKGNQYHFGMKAHIGVDADNGCVHTVTATSANVHDVTEASQLIRDEDEVVYGDAGYTGLEKRDEIKNDPQKREKKYHTNMRPGTLRKKKDSPEYEELRAVEHAKSSVRSKVEHAFWYLKVMFGYRKCVYKGLQKNLCRIYMAFASANMLRSSRLSIAAA